MDAYARVDRDYDRQITLNDESFEFKNNIYDQIEEAVKLTTDLVYPKYMTEYRDKLQDIFDGIIETVNNVNSSKRAKRFTDDLLTILSDVVKAREAKSR